jgi:hypothetical protein
MAKCPFGIVQVSCLCDQNFFQGNTITRKDSLARCLKRMRMVYGAIYNFFPVSFNLPIDYTKFLSYFSKIQSKKGKQVFYILS